MITIEKKTLTEKIIEGMKKATVELEEFRLQAALGKAEARDVFEDVKKKFNKFVHEYKQEAGDIEVIAMDKAVKLKALLETLQVQLALGKAESKQVFGAQRKKIENALNDLETFLKNNKIANEYYTRLLLEAGKFRIKLEILKLRYELNKLETRIEFKNKQREYTKKIETVKNNLMKREKEAEQKMQQFREEVSEAYSHLKKAFT